MKFDFPNDTRVRPFEIEELYEEDYCIACGKEECLGYPLCDNEIMQELDYLYD